MHTTEQVEQEPTSRFWISTRRLTQALLVILGVFGAWVMWRSFGYGIGAYNNPGAGAWPFVVGTAMLGLSAWLFIATSKKSPGERVNYGQPFLLWTLILVWGVLLNYITFIAISSAMLFLIFKLVGKAGWIMSIVVPVVTSAVIYYVFSTLLAVPLP